MARALLPSLSPCSPLGEFAGEAEYCLQGPTSHRQGGRTALKPLPQAQPGSPRPAPTPHGERQHPLDIRAHGPGHLQSQCQVTQQGAWEVTPLRDSQADFNSRTSFADKIYLEL